MKKIPDDGILGLYVQDETQRFTTTDVYLGIGYTGYSGSGGRTQMFPTKDMVRRCPDQKIKDRNVDARRDDKTSQGAAVKWKGDGRRRIRERKPGDCSQWLSEGHCSNGDSCSFKHDEKKREKWRGRDPTRSPSRDSNWSSEGHGKGVKGKGTEGISPSG